MRGYCRIRDSRSEGSSGDNDLSKRKSARPVGLVVVQKGPQNNNTGHLVRGTLLRLLVVSKQPVDEERNGVRVVPAVGLELCNETRRRVVAKPPLASLTDRIA